MSPSSTPRRLMRKVREIMAEDCEPQERLDRVVTAIAGILSAEVSSLYLGRGDGSLELFATEGLNPEAVHNTHLSPGEGLVGLIAQRGEIMNLQEAQDHPAFSYRPETGEEIYHSFLGVPMRRGGRTLGVLTVQNLTAKHYTEAEIESLETTAMVLAELISTGEIKEALSGYEGVLQRQRSRHVRGETLSSGLALGHIVLHEPRVAITDLFSDEPEKEHKILDQGIESLRAAIEKILEKPQMGLNIEGREVFETYRMFAHDQGWIRRMHEAIDNGLTAAAAIERVQNDTRARFAQHKDPFWLERMNDLSDLGNRLLREVSGVETTADQGELPADTIVVARTMGAAELLDYPIEKLRGLVLEDASPTSHVAIVARSLGIAALGNATNIVNHVDTGDAAILDADEGDVYVRPRQDIIDAFRDKVRHRAARQKKYEQVLAKPSQTQNGTPIEMKINAGLLTDIAQMHQTGAAAIGLFRTELQFMIASKLPRMSEQMASYKAVLKEASDKPVVFRILDIGSDKILPYFRHSLEDNPAIGWRGIRLLADHPALLRMQVRALLRASAGQNLYVMLPMITVLQEFLDAKAMIEAEIALDRERGHEIATEVKIGCMIEVPSVLWQLEHIVDHADFISVGSNDMMQFFYAADRTNPHVSNRYDCLSAPFLSMLLGIRQTADKYECPVTMCGEMASDPLAAMALLGLGFRSISMAAHSMGAVKNMVVQLDLEDFGPKLQTWLTAETETLRPKLDGYAKENKIDLF